VVVVVLVVGTVTAFGALRGLGGLVGASERLSDAPIAKIVSTAASAAIFFTG
jgi:hypothetical protein